MIHNLQVPCGLIQFAKNIKTWYLLSIKERKILTQQTSWVKALAIPHQIHDWI